MRTILTTLLAACAKNPPAAAPAAPAPDPYAAVSASVESALDRSVDPCVDFYTFACGGWINSTELPPDRPIVVRSFTSIDDNNETVMRKVLEDAAASPGDDPVRQKLGALWTSCMDETAIDARGATPIAPYLAKIDSLKDKKGLLALVGELQAVGFEPLFGVGVDSDAHNPQMTILQLVQGGTGLPEKSYYLDADQAAMRTQYQDHVAKLLALSGWTEADAAKAAKDVITVETALAKVQWDPVQLRDATLTYNKLDRAGLQKITPGMDWGAFLAAGGHPELTQINVATPSFFEGEAKALTSTSMPALRNYLKWTVVNGAARELAKPIDDESFRFYGQVLSGQKEQKPRWKRCVGYADEALGDLLAQQYVSVSFPGDSKPQAQDLVRRIEAAFEAGLPTLAWMDDATRARAIEKARAVANKVGYPDVWRQYTFDVAPDDFFGNIRKGAQATNEYWLAKAEKPTDPNAWFMTAPTVNAYYNPGQNEIVFPAGILQPPMFSAEYPKALNYGAIGMVIGHELTHGFDDEGRKFDGTGRLTDWWDPSAVERFEKAALCVQDQYEGYVTVPASGDQPAVHLNGALTLGENIADLGGTRIAHRAYQIWAKEAGPQPTIAGFNGDQLFFVGLAQAWCAERAPELARMLVKVDPHSSEKYRVDGPLVNLPEFAAAFQCKEGASMAPVNRCEVW